MDNIALAFSGGGFRAASYSLGCLSYLRAVIYKGEPLLNKVSFISSTSGGSITNLVYSKYIFEGRTFGEFYDFLLAVLEGDKLLGEAIGILHSGHSWKGRPEKSQNLINAFAIAWDKVLEGETFGLFSDRSKTPHIEEICVNATEFTNGLPFRFQSQHPDLEGVSNGRIGNAYIYFSDKSPRTAELLRLSDILACSSCFPSGFEPVIFPQDFTSDELSSKDLLTALVYKANAHTRGEALDLLRDKDFDKGLHIGLMDGGVDDNQAIDAFELAAERREKDGRPPFTLFMACDVTSNFMDGYTLPLRRKSVLGALPAWFPLAFWMAGLLVLPLLFILIPSWWPGYIWVLATISALCWLPVIFWGLPALLKGLFTKHRRPQNSWSTMLRKYGPSFLLLNLGTLKQMLLARIKSVLILSTDVYLKQIRRMYYNDLYAGDSPHRPIVIQNAIYDLSRIKFPLEEAAAAPSSPAAPSPALVDMAERARMMETTLWFGPGEETLKVDVIITGQATTCYNLLKWIGKQPEAALSAELKDLQSRLRADWEKFCADPTWLYKRR